jgi:XRE family transcriptional regulator, stress-response regulator
MVLLRHLLGDALRRLRLRQGRTLREVSASARVSLGYLSEVERGQKEASSELLAAICSALGAPLSQVLREVSDNFALAELQSEPVFAEVIEPAIEIAGVGHGPGREDNGQQVPVGSGPVASLRSHGPAERRVAIPAGSRVTATVGALAAGRLGPSQLNATQLGKARKINAPAAGPSLPLGVAVADTVFDQVTRTAREITNMVPV